MTDIELFEKLGVQYQTLDGEINARTNKDFEIQFRKVFSSPLAKNLSSVVYIWSTSRGIPRMKGRSNIVYIGKTKTSLYERHYRYARLEASDFNWVRSEYIIENYGPIKVRFARTARPRDCEKDLLKWYFKEHLEYPPVNSSL